MGEEELGTPLFDRNKKSLTLNEAGQEAYRRFSAALNELDALDRALRDYRALPERITVLNSVLLFSEYLLLEYEMLHPGKIENLNRPENEVSADALFNYKATVILSPVPIDASGVVCKLVFRDQLLVRVPENSHLGRDGIIQMEELRDSHFVIGILNSSITDHIRGLLTKHGIPFPEEIVKGASQLYDPRFQTYHIRNTNSLCFTTDTAASYLEFPGYRLLMIDDPDASLPYYAIYLRRSAAAVAPFLDRLSQRAAAATQQRRAMQMRES